MNAYRPSARRPIADIFRSTAILAVAICRKFDIHPNTVSYASIVASALAAICFWQSAAAPVLLVIGALGCLIRLWLNMLDGMVALATGKASRIGEIVNELPDRISDVVIFVGIAHSGLCHMLLGYWSAILSLLVAYVGVLGQAVGVQREFSGTMSKPWRMAVLALAASLTPLWLWWQQGPSQSSSLTLIDGALIVIVIGCLQTIWVRLSRIVQALQAIDAPHVARPLDRVRL
ncbi:MAG: CDP-alcohol phosphatidyltransferase family protein [Pirellulales bacterium]